MTTVDICLIVITIFSSTCFGYYVGKNTGYKEGVAMATKTFLGFMKFEAADKAKKEE